MVRCKYRCYEVTKKAHWDKAKGFLYTAKFSAVMDDSPENKRFFEATPCGSFEVGTYKQDWFEVGKEYYIDLTPAE